MGGGVNLHPRVLRRRLALRLGWRVLLPPLLLLGDALLLLHAQPLVLGDAALLNLPNLPKPFNVITPLGLITLLVGKESHAPKMENIV